MENALGITVPKNAEIIRNIMVLTQYVQDHVIHFYHLHALDWVDVVSALKADPAATAALAQKVSPHWPTSTPGYFSDVAGTLKKFVESGQLGIFQNAYWGHPAYKLPPEANLMAVAHYLEALKWQKEIIKIHTIFGGKNPHPNYLVGGVASAINLQGDNAINMERLNMVHDLIVQDAADRRRPVRSRPAGHRFVLSGMDQIGGGLGNYMVYGDIPQNGIGDPSKFRFPRGVILNKNLAEVLPLDLADTQQIQEEVAHSWYKYPDGKTSLHPWEGVTEANYTGPKPPYKQLGRKRRVLLAEGAALEGPRHGSGAAGAHAGRLCQRPRRIQRSGHRGVGPAQAGTSGAVLHARPHGRPRPGNPAGCQLAARRVRPADRQPEMRRHSHRRHTGCGIRRPGRRTAKASASKRRRAARSATGSISKTRRSPNYQIVVPSTWNASPKDAQGQHGAYEAALLGTPMADPQTAGGDSADHPFLRSLPGLRLARHQSGGRIAGRSDGALGGCYG